MNVIKMPAKKKRGPPKVRQPLTPKVVEPEIKGPVEDKTGTPRVSARGSPTQAETTNEMINEKLADDKEFNIAKKDDNTAEVSETESGDKVKETNNV